MYGIGEALIRVFDWRGLDWRELNRIGEDCILDGLCWRGLY